MARRRRRRDAPEAGSLAPCAPSALQAQIRRQSRGCCRGPPDCAAIPKRAAVLFGEHLTLPRSATPSRSPPTASSSSDPGFNVIQDTSTPQRWFTHIRLLGSHLTHHMRLFRSAHHPDSFTEAACGGLRPPPAGRSRRAHLHHRCSTATIGTIFYIATSSRVRGTPISTSLASRR